MTMTQNLLSQIFPVTPWVTLAVPALFNTIVAFLLGLFVTGIYRATHRGVSYSYSFIITIVILPMVASLVMMIIGNNLARAFGLVGALSIIRFRTAVKDSRDTAFVFYSLVAGMAVGTGNVPIGIAGTLFIGLLIGILYLTGFSHPNRDELLLRFNVAGGQEARKLYLSIFQQFLNSSSLINVKSIRLGESLELAFRVVLKDSAQTELFARELSGLEGIDRVNLSYGEEQGEP